MNDAIKNGREKKNVVDVERDVAEEKRGEYCW